MPWDTCRSSIFFRGDFRVDDRPRHSRSSSESFFMMMGASVDISGITDEVTARLPVPMNGINSFSHNLDRKRTFPACRRTARAARPVSHDFNQRRSLLHRLPSMVPILLGCIFDSYKISDYPIGKLFPHHEARAFLACENSKMLDAICFVNAVVDGVGHKVAGGNVNIG